MTVYWEEQKGDAGGTPKPSDLAGSPGALSVTVSHAWVAPQKLFPAHLRSEHLMKATAEVATGTVHPHYSNMPPQVTKQQSPAKSAPGRATAPSGGHPSRRAARFPFHREGNRPSERSEASLKVTQLGSCRAGLSNSHLLTLLCHCCLHNATRPLHTPILPLPAGRRPQREAREPSRPCRHRPTETSEREKTRSEQTSSIPVPVSRRANPRDRHGAWRLPAPHPCE